ncbi:hypothetical protein PVL29_001022 [Vitis rotundifolia]|uniref:Transcription factor MYB106 n=3 Tax=Vitis TaxID=3603 RepID=F6HPP5_VITVI|nr:transcription factor MYB106 [Vitis vinifera]KAJ9709351.1 hypothetical protein PVL29_001022 [Vitis rotundifolia]RVW32054.1 Transcription factor MYB106 [Vitis vinifera]WJZ81141.1 hypothetical protein VitviT2T_000997 [Vitis vinifera]|eukprot:XP_002268469.2 PREDICTED: myb-related protein 306 [Vitis vinifera]
MGRSPCCEKVGLKKGSWTPEEDQKLMSYIEEHGHGSWRALPAKAGLQRCGKSCRLRWTNYLRPDIKRGKFSLQEEQTIIQLHALLGNRWSAIATHLPKRTDNEIKNYWNTHLKKRLTKMGIDPVTHKPKSYALGSATGQSKDAANLSHMAQWESARLEAEARFVREYKLSPHPFQHQYKQGLSATALSITHSLAPPKTLDVVNAWQGLWSSGSTNDCAVFGDTLFNSSENALPAALPSSTLGLGVNENSMEKGENDWKHCFERQNKVPEFIKDNATPFPDMQYSTDESTWIADSVGNNNIVISCATFNVDGFSHHLLPENSSLSFGEDSDNANANCTAGSAGGGFEENNHYWNNIISLLDSSSAYYSLENV